MQPIFYSSKDAVAPRFTDTFSLFDILKKCLVTGYGNQQGAGWSLLFDAWNQPIGTARNASFAPAGGGVFGLWHANAGSSHAAERRHTQAYTASSMLDASHPVEAFSVYNRVRITDTAALLNTSALSVGVTNASEWALVANNQFFIFFYGASGFAGAGSNGPRFLAGGKTRTGQMVGLCAKEGQSGIELTCSPSTLAGYEEDWIRYARADVFPFTVDAGSTCSALCPASAHFDMYLSNEGRYRYFDLGALPGLFALYLCDSLSSYAGTGDLGRLSAQVLHESFELDGKPMRVFYLPTGKGSPLFLSLDQEDWVNA